MADKATKTTRKKTKAEEIQQLKDIIEAEEAVVNEEAAEIVAVEEKTDANLAKAGKRSAKAFKETEEKLAKDARKADDKSGKTKPEKSAAKQPRSKVERAGRKYQALVKLIDKSKTYNLTEALELVAKTNPAKFDATVEMHLNLGVDPKQADQNVRDTVALPAGTGKVIKIAVIAESDDAKKALAAGADISDSEQIFADLDKEIINFDVLICVPTMMAKLGKYARLLGPRGLMPNPKSGTVTTNVSTAVKEAKAGRVEYRVDQSGIIHLAIGKVSFTPAQLAQNAETVLSSVKSAKPSSLKGIYIKSGYVSSSMGPSIKFEV